MANDPTGILVRQMLGAVAQYEKSQIVLQTPLRACGSGQNRAVVKDASRTGIYDGESAVLERLKALRAEGLGYNRIALRMNEEGIPTRTGKAWHGVVVTRILTGRRWQYRA